jgi:acetylornithine/N-succinyldiaminopimelate aminotransferase
MNIMVESNEALVEQAKHLFMPNYKPAPFVIARGEGCWLFDVEGNKFLDLVGGIAVSVLGHAHPRLVEAITTQVSRVLHTSNLYLNRPAIELAKALVDAWTKSARSVGAGDPGGVRVFFCNSGAEANEGQLKLARRYAWDRGEKSRTKIVAFDHSFHGRTYGALAATGQPKYHEGFGKMLEGFVHVPYGDVDALRRVVDKDTAAVLVEPLQGEGGVRVPPPGFIAACRELATKNGALLLFDEVQVGVGRTGKMFCFEQEGVVPDMLSLAKGIGGGLPLGAVLAKEDVAAHLAYGTHATTFGGNPVACAAGTVVFDVLSEPGFLDRVTAIGAYLTRGLRELGERHRAFQEVRGRGLLIGAQLRQGVGFDAKSVVDACRARDVLIHVAGTDVLRLAPALILTEAEAKLGLEAIDQAIGSLVKR